MGKMQRRTIAGGLFAVLMVGACGSPPPDLAPGQPAPPQIAFEVLAEGLSFPVSVVQARDRTRRLFVVEQTGTIRTFEGGKLSSKPFLDVSNLTEHQSERGLLNLAFHPDYRSNRKFYIYYTATTTGTVTIAEYKRSKKNPDRASPGSARIILEIIHPVFNHNGGSMAFGPDGYLYIGVGDGGGA